MAYKYEIYEKPLSNVVKRLMYKVMKNSTNVVQGFIFFRDRTIVKAHFDEEECDKVLEAMIVNKDNVIRYLGRKYVPTFTENGAIFKDQRCIQKVIIKEDKTLYIHIANSEPHKIITDTIHVMNLLRAKGFDFIPEIKFYIEQLKIAFQDTMTYNLCLVEFGYKVPAPAKIYERQLRKKYGNLEEIAAIKMRSVKRKFLRTLVKEGQIVWEQLRMLINMENEDYTQRKIKELCTQIRDEQKAKGIIVKY